MRVSQYMRLEKAIAAADKQGMRERILWGLRLLDDPDAFAKGGNQLKPNVAEQLSKEAAARGYKLSEREIQYRLKAARTYKTENEIAHACAAFDSWSSLREAGFPSFEVPEDEPPADYRTKAERTRDRDRALLELIDEQGTLFPLDDFEPTSSTLKELQDYTVEMEELTARFAERDRKRRAYLEELIKAADNDLSMTWKDAHDRLGDEADDLQEPPLDPEDM